MANWSTLLATEWRFASMRVSELENRQARKRLEGSNPSPSAIYKYKYLIFLLLRQR